VYFALKYHLGFREYSIFAIGIDRKYGLDLSLLEIGKRSLFYINVDPGYKIYFTLELFWIKII